MTTLYVPQLIKQAKQSKPNLPDWEHFISSSDYVPQWGEALGVTQKELLKRYKVFLEKNLPDPMEWLPELTDLSLKELSDFWNTYSNNPIPTELNQLLDNLVSLYVDRYYWGKPLEETVEYDFLSEFLRQLEMHSTFAFPEDYLSRFVAEVRKTAEETCSEYLTYFEEDLQDALASANSYAKKLQKT